MVLEVVGEMDSNVGHWTSQVRVRSSKCSRKPVEFSHGHDIIFSS